MYQPLHCIESIRQTTARLLGGELAGFPSQPLPRQDDRLLEQVCDLGWAGRASLGLQHPAGAARNYSRAGALAAWLPQPTALDQRARASRLQARPASGRWLGRALGGDVARLEYEHLGKRALLRHAAGVRSCAKPPIE